MRGLLVQQYYQAKDESTSRVPLLHYSGSSDVLSLLRRTDPHQKTTTASKFRAARTATTKLKTLALLVL